MTAAPDRVRVRPLRHEDVGDVVDLVRKEEFARDHSPEVLRRLFEYPWARERPHSGFVITAGEKIVGCAGAIFSTRTIDGREQRFCNTTTWYVEPEYRGHSLLLLTALMGLRDHTLVTLTASADVARVLEKVAFEVISRRRLFLGPASRPLTAFPRRRRILDSEREIERVLTDEHRRILADHLPFGCHHYVVEEGDRYAYVVTKRRSEKGWFLPRGLPRRVRERGYPVSYALYVSDPALVLRHWAPLCWRIVRREQTLGVTVEESFLGPLEVRARSTPHHVHTLRRRGDPRSIDALYSELVLLLPG